MTNGTRRGWGVSVTPRPLFTPGKDTVPIVQEAGWAPGPVWTGTENLAPTRIRSLDRPASSQSLYRLSYRGPANVIMYQQIQITTIKIHLNETSTLVYQSQGSKIISSQPNYDWILFQSVWFEIQFLILMWVTLLCWSNYIIRNMY
jgi:hypothetical protein